MGHILKRITSIFLSSILTIHLGAITSYGKPDWPADTGIMAEAGIVIDADSKAVLFGQKIHVPLPPASITKLLTALIVVENAEMDETVTFSHDAVYNVEAGSGNKLALDEGDQISVKDCLHMMLLLSSNQSANALAEHVAGSREAFVEMMNQRIGMIGCTESHFANPSGLNDDNQYVTAYDMALIAAAAFENESVFQISSTKKYTIGPTINNPEGANISMGHKILMAENQSNQYYCEGAVAGKTGFTSIAGNTLVTYATREGRNLLCVILKGSQPQYYLDGKTLLNFGFASFKNESIKNSETFLGEQDQVECESGTYPVSQLRIEDGVITLPAGAQFMDAQRTLMTQLPKNSPEAAVAILQYTYHDRKVGSAYLFDTELEAELAAAREKAERDSMEAEAPSVSGMEETDSLPEETQAEKETDRVEVHLDLGQILVIVMGIGVAAALGLAVFAAVQRKRRERLARELRRQRRRQRLEEIGYSEESFEELVKKRRGSQTASRTQERENG